MRQVKQGGCAVGLGTTRAGGSARRSGRSRGRLAGEGEIGSDHGDFTVIRVRVGGGT